ncbi:hypothetical protein GCM10012287_43750 [Streptomyces daqingensis]|uniref:Uncharacterized protein n=1 Tax=Streptomyces daqingensis TaxID=1472640 RepID=A0ABQ2MMK0_9ACTN|nr:hypothetical protein GCM10012287_43750 [Streptomyces daqingensis]
MAAAALLAYAARRRLVEVALAVALTGGGVLVGTAGSLWRTDPGALALRCSDGSPKVRMINLHRSFVSPVSRALQDVKARLHGIPNAPDRLVEVPLAGYGHPAPGAHVPGRTRPRSTHPRSRRRRRRHLFRRSTPRLSRRG